MPIGLIVTSIVIYYTLSVILAIAVYVNGEDFSKALIQGLGAMSLVYTVFGAAAIFMYGCAKLFGM